MAEVVESQGTERNLKRVLTGPQVFGIGFGQIVGGGIVSLTGAAIALTGPGVPVAFVLAAVAVVLYSLPYAALGSAVSVTGAQYSYPARILGRGAGFATMWLIIIIQVSLSIYALGAAQYLHALFGQVPVRPVAVGIATLFLLLNLAGAAISGRVGMVMGGIMVVAFIVFGAVGMGSVDWVQASNVVPNGMSQLLTAAALVTFATGGGVVVAELGNEMKRPERDIPMGLIGATVVAALLYVLVAIPASGVLPIAKVANQPLSVVADKILPTGPYLFFIVGGALFALVTTMNSQLLTQTKSVLAAINDGWFPRGLGAVNKRFGTPHWLLLILYGIGVAPIIGGFSIAAVGGAAAGVGQLIFSLVVISSYRARQQYPLLFERAPFRLPKWLHLVLVVVSVLVNIYLASLLFRDMSTTNLLILAGWVVVGVAYFLYRWRRVRQHPQRGLRRAETETSVTGVPSDARDIEPTSEGA